MATKGVRYLLAVLTCGRPDYLRRTLEAYADFLDPQPEALLVWDDGLQTPVETFSPFSHLGQVVEGKEGKLGTFAAHAELWRATRRAEYDHLDYVFVAEDDVLLLRPLNVTWMRELLDTEPDLEQVALVRAPYPCGAGAEMAMGGFIPMFPDRYNRRTTTIGDNTCKWISSQWDWTSSPALLRMSLTREVDWPIHDSERALGPLLMERNPNAVSGYWGWGEAICSHIGLESGGLY